MSDDTTDADTETVHTDTETTTAPDVASGNEQVDESDATSPDRKLKAESKRLRQERNKWQKVALAAYERRADQIMHEEATHLQDPDALRRFLGELAPFVNDDGDFNEDEWRTHVTDTVQAISPKRTRDPDQGRGRGETGGGLSIGEQMRRSGGG
jgi:hypothetical protein